MITITDNYMKNEGIKYRHGLLVKDLWWVGSLQDLFSVKFTDREDHKNITSLSVSYRSLMTNFS